METYSVYVTWSMLQVPTTRLAGVILGALGLAWGSSLLQGENQMSSNPHKLHPLFIPLV